MPQAPADATERPATLDEVVEGLARQHGIPPSLALAVARKESSLNPGAVGDGGQAIGVFQLHAGAAADTGTTDRTDPLQNITGGIKYLKQLSDRYKGDVSKTLMAYNGGMAGVDTGTPSPQAQAYAAEVLGEISKGMRAGAGKTAGAGAGGPGGAGGTATTTTAPSGKAKIDAAMNHYGGADIIPHMLGTVDPRHPEGRENLAGMAGAAGMAVLTAAAPEVSIPVRIAQVLGPIVSASIFGGAEHKAEELAGSVKPGTTTLPVTGTAVSGTTAAALRQGAYEAGGQLFMWPIRAVGQRLIAPRVANEAAEGLKAEGISIRDRGYHAVEQVRTQLADTLSVLKRTAQSALDTAKSETGDLVRRATRSAGDLLADAELKNADTITQATKAFDDLRKAPPSVGDAAATVKTTVEGPAKRALDIAGQQVDMAAAQATAAGVKVDVKPGQTALVDMANKARPAVLFGEAPTTDTTNAIGYLTHLKQQATAAAASGSAKADALEKFHLAVASQLGIDPATMHPQLPGLLGKILDADTPWDFDQAHAAKRLLDEAVNWDRTAKKHLERVTKGVRIALRDAMRDAGVPAYEQANAVYASLVPIYRKGIGATVIKLSQAPDGAARVASLLKDHDPISAATLKNLLVDQSAAGGDPQVGRQAWDQVRAAFTYDHLISRGVDKLGSSLDTLLTTRPEFVRAVYGDATGSQVLSNLGHIAEAVKAADTIAAERMTAAKQIGAAGVDEAKQVGQAALTDVRRRNIDLIAQARQQGQSGVRAAKDLVTTQQAQHAAKVTRFKDSSVGKFAGRSLEDEGADVVRAVALGPGSYWGGVSILRLLRGARSRDLLEWAAYSTPNTQRLVRLLTKPGPPQAAAALLRMAGGVFGSSTDAPVAAAAPAPASTSTLAPSSPAEAP